MPRPNPPRLVQAEETLAERIEEHRREKGWSYEGLAERMDRAGCAIQPSALYKIEKGQPRRRITVDELVGLAAAFGVTVDELLFWSPSFRAQQVYQTDLAEGPAKLRSLVMAQGGYDALIKRIALAMKASAPIRAHFLSRAAEAEQQAADPEDSITVQFFREVESTFRTLEATEQ